MVKRPNAAAEAYIVGADVYTDGLWDWATESPA
jgi:hypothetical protein